MVSDNLLLASPLLREIAPFTLAGYARFREITDMDGALPARIKALFVAAAATVKGYRELAHRELMRGFRLGLAYEEATAGVIILSSLRGEGAALSFQTLVEDVYGRKGDPKAPPVSLEVAPGEAEANFKEYFGTVPPALAKLLDLMPLGADAYYLMRRGTLLSTPLGTKNAELLLVVVLCADYSPMASVHIKGARRVGASETEIIEAILCALPSAGLASWAAGAAAMDAP